MSDYFTPFICKMNKLLSFLNFFKLLQKLVDERKESQRLREYIAELTSKILEHAPAILEDSKSQTKSAEAGKAEITMSKPIAVATQRRDSKTDSKFNYKRLFKS